MLRFYDYDGNIISIDRPIPNTLHYIITETKEDEDILINIIDYYLCKYNKDKHYVTGILDRLKRCLHRHRCGVGESMNKEINSKAEYLLAPNIWVYSTLSWSWVLSNHIIYDATKLNSKLKSKSKTENQIRNSNFDSEIENEI